jgi:stage II sporulation protein D
MRTVIVLLTLVVGRVVWTTDFSAHTAQPIVPGSIRVQVDGRIRTVPLEEYVLGSALSEVSPVDESPSAAERIFEIQAILARTYASAHVGRHGADRFDLCDGTHCQLYQPDRIRTSRFAAIARRAVSRTAGEVLTFNGRPIDALFHADCGGATAAAADVWGGPRVPYLVGGPDLDAAPHRAWQFEAPAGRLRTALNAEAPSAVGRRLDAIRVVARDASGRAARLLVTGEHDREVRGDEFRAILNRTFGDRAIQSTRFELSRRGATFVFSGTGYGHGVGLCQVGAATRARRGDAVAAILQAYFPGTELTRAVGMRG